MTSSRRDTVTPLGGATVLVTGALGFLGRPLVRALLDQGAIVHAVARRRPEAASECTWWQLDVADGGALRRVLADVRPQLVYHLTTAGGGGRELELVEPTVRDDLLASVEVLRAAVECGLSRLVLTGSMEEPEPSTEATPSSPYAAAKWASSGYARMFHALYDLDVVILRPYMTYGPGQRPQKLVPYVIQSLLAGESPAVGSGGRPVDWVYLDDMIDAFVRAGTAEAASGATIELGSGTLITVGEVVEMVYRLIGSTARPEFGAIPDRALEVVRAAETERAATLLGWRATTTLRHGLQRTIDWHRTHRDC